jgi:hypothetical protein
MLNTESHRRVLLPFTDARLLAESLDPALEMAQSMSAEVWLLRVYPMTETSDCTPDEETLYSELRGIQARLQRRSPGAHIDTITGPTARSIASYAGEHGVDLIMLSETGDVKEGVPLVERVAHRTTCETVLIKRQEN